MTWGMGEDSWEALQATPLEMKDILNVLISFGLAVFEDPLMMGLCGVGTTITTKLHTNQLNLVTTEVLDEINSSTGESAGRSTS